MHAKVMKHVTILFAFCALLTGCAIERAQVAETAQSQMTGMTREQVLACMGPPNQRMTEGKTEVWSYGSGGATISQSFGDSHATGSATISGNTIYGSANGTSSEFSIAQRRYCIVNVIISDATVSAVKYSGPTGGLVTEGEQCAYAVRACVRK